MASGFIILKDGRCFGRRWTIYDSIIELIIENLGDNEDEKALSDWLQLQIPSAEDDESEDAGFGFVSKKQDAFISRELDIRGLHLKNQDLFWRAFINGKSDLENKPNKNKALISMLEDFYEMYQLAEQGEDPLEMSDWGRTANPCMKRLGPGWDKPDNTLKYFLDNGEFETISMGMKKDELFNKLGKPEDYLTVSHTDDTISIVQYGHVEFYFCEPNNYEILDGILIQPLLYPSDNVGLDVDYEWIESEMDFCRLQSELVEREIGFKKLKDPFGNTVLETAGKVRFYFDGDDNVDLNYWKLNKLGRFLYD